jgi:hypothetical protein
MIGSMLLRDSTLLVLQVGRVHGVARQGIPRTAFIERDAHALQSNGTSRPWKKTWDEENSKSVSAPRGITASQGH